MRRIIFTVFLLVFISNTVVSAKLRPDTNESKFDKIGVGLLLGDPLGISGKMWISKEMAFDGVISVSAVRPFYVHADYLLHNYELLKAQEKESRLKSAVKDPKATDFIFYYGAGAYASYWSSGAIGIGARLPVGIEYLVNPFDIFVELAPTFSLTPSMGLSIYGGIGVRFNF